MLRTRRIIVLGLGLLLAILVLRVALRRHNQAQRASVLLTQCRAQKALGRRCGCDMPRTSAQAFRPAFAIMVDDKEDRSMGISMLLKALLGAGVMSYDIFLFQRGVADKSDTWAPGVADVATGRAREKSVGDGGEGKVNEIALPKVEQEHEEYKFAMDLLFRCHPRDYSHVVIVQDYLELAPDFLSYLDNMVRAVAEASKGSATGGDGNRERVGRAAAAAAAAAPRSGREEALEGDGADVGDRSSLTFDSPPSIFAISLSSVNGFESTSLGAGQVRLSDAFVHGAWAISRTVYNSAVVPLWAEVTEDDPLQSVGIMQAALLSVLVVMDRIMQRDGARMLVPEVARAAASANTQEVSRPREATDYSYNVHLHEDDFLAPGDYGVMGRTGGLVEGLRNYDRSVLEFIAAAVAEASQAGHDGRGKAKAAREEEREVEEGFEARASSSLFQPFARGHKKPDWKLVTCPHDIGYLHVHSNIVLPLEALEDGDQTWDVLLENRMGLQSRQAGQVGPLGGYKGTVLVRWRSNLVLIVAAYSSFVQASPALAHVFEVMSAGAGGGLGGALGLGMFQNGGEEGAVENEAAGGENGAGAGTDGATGASRHACNQPPKEARVAALRQAKVRLVLGREGLPCSFTCGEERCDDAFMFLANSCDMVRGPSPCTVCVEERLQLWAPAFTPATGTCHHSAFERHLSCTAIPPGNTQRLCPCVAQPRKRPGLDVP